MHTLARFEMELHKSYRGMHILSCRLLRKVLFSCLMFGKESGAITLTVPRIIEYLTMQSVVISVSEAH